jgi:isopentenyl-diphosphate delta-isomerase
MEEYFEIVDENNLPTGEKKPRSEVHRTGLWHRTVHIYLFRKVGDKIEFLVHLRSKNKDLHPNKWDTRFGGHLKAGESIEEAVKNEMEEETGLKIRAVNLTKGEIYKRDHYPNNEFTNVFYYEFGGEISELKFNDGEVQKVSWMSSKKIIKSMADKPDEWSGGVGGFEEILDVLKTKI